MRREKKLPSSGSCIIWSLISVLMSAHKFRVILFPVAIKQAQGPGFYKKHGLCFNAEKNSGLWLVQTLSRGYGNTPEYWSSPCIAVIFAPHWSGRNYHNGSRNMELSNTCLSKMLQLSEVAVSVL
jgi:hypothetical protein